MSRHSVLIMSLEDDLRHMLEFGLSHEGFSVRFAEDEDAALQALEAEHGPVVVIDIDHPSGERALKEIRSRKSAHRLVLVGSGDAGLDEHGNELEGLELVRKPFPLEELAVALRGAVERRRS
jgi:DNA-binding response OmpR family regulator